MELQIDLADWIRRNGETRHSFAQRAGIPGPTVYDLCAGRVGVGPITIPKLIRATGLDYATLFGEEAA